MKTPSVAQTVRVNLTRCLLLSALCSLAVVAAPPPPPAHIVAGETAPGGSGTATLTWSASAGATSYKIYKRNHATDVFTQQPSGNVTIAGTTAQLTGLDDLDSYELAVVAVNAAAEESAPTAAVVPYACRRTPMSLPWDDQRYSPGASFDHLNRTVSATSKAIPYDDEAYRVSVDPSGQLVVNAAGTPIPIRFTGVNIVWSGAFPTAADAPKIAARMAQFGINLVRFHNLDAYAAGETAYPQRVGWFESDFATLNEARLDRFDNFVNELAHQGIYSDINLCVGRKFPDENNPSGPYQRFKGLDQMDPDIIQRQKDFATALLNHANPYRGNTLYKNDPAVAVLEIDNEAGLITTWASGGFDPGATLPLTGVYSAELATRWSDWLRATRGYGSVDNAALQTLWAADTHAYTQVGTELLADRDFALFPGSSSPWKFQVSSPAAATCAATTDTLGGVSKAVLVADITQADPSAPGRVKLLYSSVSSYIAPSFDYRVPHALRFHARIGTSEAARTITVGFRKNGSPYTQFHSVKLALTSQWQQFDVLLPAVLTGPTTIDLTFTDLAAQTGHVWLSDVSLVEGNPFNPNRVEYAEPTAVVDTSDHVPDVLPASPSNSSLIYLPWYDSANGLSSADGWTFVDKTADASAYFSTGANLTVYRNAGYEASTSDVYVRRTGLNFVAGRAYELSFDARFTPLSGSSLTKTRLAFSVGLDASPFTVYHSGTGDVSTAAWSTHKVVFVASSTSTSRVLLMMGRLRGTLEFRNVQLAETTLVAAQATDTLVGSGTVGWPTKGDFRRRTRAFQRDWMNFLWETESAYFKTMRDHLKTTLSARPLVLGSQGEYSPNYLQAQEMDIVDVHGYWNHPYDLDGQGYIKNNSMAGVASGGALAPRQAKRILGKPFFCTEYNHPHPGTFGSEAFPLLAAFAGFHAWSGVVAFQYEDNASSWDRGFEDSAYMVGRSTGKMVNYPFLAQALRAGRFDAASTRSMLVVDKATVIDALLGKLTGGIGVGDFTSGSSSVLSPSRSLAGDLVTTMSDPLNAGAATPTAYAVQPSAPLPSVALFDSGDQSWDTTANAEIVQIVAPQAKALIGKLSGGQTYDLQDGVVIVPSVTMQDNGQTPARYWAGYSLTLKDGTSFGAPGSRWLVATMGYTDNLFRKWEAGHGPYDTDNKIAYQQGGAAPNFVERIRGTLQFNVAGSDRLTAWDLDEDGNRIAPLEVTYSGAGATRIASVSLPSSPVSAWYEFSVALDNTPLAMSCTSTNGYATNQTAIGVVDTALAANAIADTEAPFRNAAWVSTTTAAGVSDADTLRVVSGSSTYAGDTGYALSLYDAGTGRGAKLDLRGQNIPLDKSWSFEVALRFDSGSYDQDELHAVIGQDRDLPVVSLALVRNGATANYKLRLLTRTGWVDLPDAVANATYVKVKVTVNPAQAGGSNPNGTMAIYVDGVQKLASTTLELPSTTALPDQLHLFTGDITTGIGRIDALKVTIP